MQPITLRGACVSDAESIARIYRPIVETTTISFEEVAPGADEIAGRMRKRLDENYPWLVACDDEELAGYAYAGRFRERPAYRYSVEVSVYVDSEHRRHGVGGALYRELFSQLEARGFHRAFAGIALPNGASVAMHEKAGFEPVGVYREAGWKFGRWVDVAWMQRAI